jgi:hypothetical protein
VHVEVLDGGGEQLGIVVELSEPPLQLKQRSPRTRLVTWSWSTCSAGRSRQIAHRPPCASSIMAASAALIP